MKKQGFNPYLPPYEYIPDGEPRVFGDRVYVYGSHDEVEGLDFCTGDYVVWSAAVDDLANWTYHGISYKKIQDPSSENGTKALFAPDVVKGADGRYYLYYCLCFVKKVSVAVSDQPEGPFDFYGYVKYPKDIYDGKDLEEHNPFDPGVLVDEDNKVYLYYGFAVNMMIKGKRVVGSPGSMASELEEDMLTLKKEPVMVVPNSDNGLGTSFEGHGFYEASSIRKRNGLYYFIYSSQLGHELCYATAPSPLGPFVYGGIIVSNGDLGLAKVEKPVALMGNNHGSIVEILGHWYVFYHRHTHASSFCRQGCAEKIYFQPDGSIEQVEISSCGLNQGPLKAEGEYPAYIACHLTTPDMPDLVIVGESLQDRVAFIKEETCHLEEKDRKHYIANISHGTIIGFKYFDMNNNPYIELELRGRGDGTIKIMKGLHKEDIIGEERLRLDTNKWQRVKIKIKEVKGEYPLYFKFNLKGSLEFESFYF